ncbi:MAG: 3-hydroxyacyl-ACP dehydratase FabZ [Elusimicrobiaceae bacterium]|jgi:3-hydroxyacyl-[acyl-carrier-protein] dehydratase|nr:3-hydroxyacyl-ACP dehydratase FabZ [Elusimicrobiaceae bacterium]MBT4008528.1 3-hydroxyacyl-ACP dehydratase FabZ [Elusimicrobiaceae bacterium]MBT4440124.1 3-hydroxyacyl-ACP dehydratase FabZ [Elusimicrobiaceae bacterium]MBT7283557.1 3-hydroxyacyl-ACP dehydratase FabZ [Elusimicrobiaceae bacterium]
MSNKEDLKFLLEKEPVETINQDEIKERIPHREPFLFLDRLDTIENLKYAIGIKKLTGEEDFFKGHFPSKPVMPGVLILEAMAQTTGAMIMGDAKWAGHLAYFISIDSAKFRGMVCPGDELKMVISVLRLGKITKIFAQAFVEGKLVTEAKLNFIIGEKNE